MPLPILIRLFWYWKRNSFHHENKKPASELMQAFLLTICFCNYYASVASLLFL